jgi:hypothetical protein
MLQLKLRPVLLFGAQGRHRAANIDLRRIIKMCKKKNNEKELIQCPLLNKHCIREGCGWYVMIVIETVNEG